MVPAIDVKHINPFLQSSISIVESVTQVKMTVGKPEILCNSGRRSWRNERSGDSGNSGEQCKGDCIPYDVRNASQ